MIKIFTWIVVVILATLLITMLAEMTGFTVIVLEGTRVDVPTNLLIGLAIAGLLAFFFGGAATSWLAGLPARLRRRSNERKRARGMTALARGLEAVAAGDSGDAQRHARIASSTLEDKALTRLLTAQAAQLAGDTETAQSSYAAMLEAPETEFLGLRGLYMHALESGDREEARAYAERAFQLRPGTSWAFESVLRLNLERGAWGDALEAIGLARQHDVAEGPRYKRMEGALLGALADGAASAGDAEEARKNADSALKKAPSLTPAAALGAELAAKAGNRAKAAKILSEAWQSAPHPGLAAVMRRTFEQERDEKVQGRLVKLAERNPDHPESRLLLAEVQLKGGDAAAAQSTLEPLLVGRPPRRVLTMMAMAVEARYGAEAAKPWFTRAESAPPEFIPGLDGSFHYTTEGWRRLIREFAEHERLAPPPLEVEAPELLADEVRALLAPPESEAEPETPADDASPTSEPTAADTSNDEAETAESQTTDRDLEKVT